ncbi:MAG: DUF1315 family protein [Pseudomonadota bacterium]
MNYDELIDSLSPDVIDRLRRGVETGRWPDGTDLTDEQREHSLRALIAWDERHLPAEERVGYIDAGSKAVPAADGDVPLRWADRDGKKS